MPLDLLEYKAIAIAIAIDNRMVNVHNVSRKYIQLTKLRAYIYQFPYRLRKTFTLSILQPHMPPTHIDTRD